MGVELQDVAARRGDDLLQPIGALSVADLISLPVAPALDDVAAVGPAFRLARVLNGALTGRRVAERFAHRAVLKDARQGIVLRQTIVGVVRRARRRRALDAR